MDTVEINKLLGNISTLIGDEQAHFKINITRAVTARKQ